MSSPLESVALFHLGPFPISKPVVTTWDIMVALMLGAFLLTRRLERIPTRHQAMPEAFQATSRCARQKAFTDEIIDLGTSSRGTE